MWWAEVIGLLIRPSSMDESSNKNLISILSKSDFDNDFDAIAEERLCIPHLIFSPHQRNTTALLIFVGKRPTGPRKGKQHRRKCPLKDSNLEPTD